MKKIAIGIFNQEIFLVEVDENNNVHRGCDKQPIFCVLRPISKSELERLRDEDDIKENVEDIWREAVYAGGYKGSLDDYVEEVIAESGMDDDEETFPFKDESWLCDINDVREQADKFIKETYGYEIGTWEAGGLYEPGFQSEFTGFDFVFNTPEAQEFAEAYEKERGI